MRKAFTLIEIMIVLVIIGTLAGVMLPRMSFYFEPASALLQRAIEQASNMALSGTPVRFSIEHGITSRRGVIVAEALKKVEEAADSLSAFLGTAWSKPVVLEWQKIDMKDIPDSEGWQFSPEVIYFYSDGSCSPARITFAPRGVSESDAEEYVLTVTGYCVKLEK